MTQRQLCLQERSHTDASISLPLDDRWFDLVLISNWEDQIVYEPDEDATPAPLAEPPTDLTAPQNKVLESGAWTQSIIWSPRAPFRDFTQLELNDEDIISEERPPGETLSVRCRVCVLTTPQRTKSRGRARG